MKIKHRNADLPVSMLYPHPGNPRKDVGDVAELAESIKANGIFQNLTVIMDGAGVEKAHPDEDVDGYTVIIGHRRLAAAKLAGLEVVPCMVVEMDEREQAATMLLENMQRSDLTVYEQAQGFQMMLDLGETQEGIAKKTGFSKTTIRHRLKLLDLDPEELRKSQERQATFADYIELEKISDPQLKNEALRAIGTNNFKWTVERVVKKEATIRNNREWNEYCSSILKKIPFDERFNYCQVGYYSMSQSSLDDKKKQEVENAIASKGAKYYTITDEGSEYAWLYIYADKSGPTAEEQAEAAEREKQQEERRKRDATMNELESQARELRKAFVKEFANREHILTLTEELLKCPNLDDIDYNDVAEYLSIEIGEDESWEDLLNGKKYAQRIKQHPESVILAMLASVNEGLYRTTLHDFSGLFKRNENLELWYAILCRVGYKLSRDERMLLSGTHDCFK